MVRFGWIKVLFLPFCLFITLLSLFYTWFIIGIGSFSWFYYKIVHLILLLKLIVMHFVILSFILSFSCFKYDNVYIVLLFRAYYYTFRYFKNQFHLINETFLLFSTLFIFFLHNLSFSSFKEKGLLAHSKQISELDHCSIMTISRTRLNRQNRMSTHSSRKLLARVKQWQIKSTRRNEIN